MEETDPAVMLRSALSIDDIDHVCLPPDERICVIWVNISERPDLAPLAVHNTQKASDAVCSWFYGNPGKRNMIVGLRITIRQPANAIFTLAFEMERFVGHLLSIAKYGKLWIIPGPPPSHSIGSHAMDAQTFLTHVVTLSGQGVVIELESHLVTALRTRLDEWKRIQ
jgi:hypothetical protein